MRIEGEPAAPFAVSLLRADAPVVGSVPSLRLVADPVMPEGSYRIESAHDGGLTLTGDPFSGLIYAARAVVAGGVPTDPWATVDSPQLPLRTLWTWDHSTNWDERVIGRQEMGALNPYQKPADAFLADYTRLVDFASRERIGAIVVYGLLRDAHGGVDAARALCEYANLRGVRILAGVGINAYGGVYFDGRHDYNLATWLRRRPDLAATMPPHVGSGMRHLVEVYWDNIFDLEAQKPLADLPDDVAYQYCVNRAFWLEHRDRLTAEHVAALPHRTNVLRTHAGSQWNHQRHALIPELFADMAVHCARAGMRGLTIFAEPSAYHASNELNYLAYARFSWDPTLDFDDFWRTEVAVMLGGTGEADAFRADARVLDDPGATPAALDEIIGQAMEIATASAGEVRRRWLWLAERASRLRYCAE